MIEANVCISLNWFEEKCALDWHGTDVIVQTKTELTSTNIPRIVRVATVNYQRSRKSFVEVDGKGCNSCRIRNTNVILSLECINSVKQWISTIVIKLLTCFVMVLSSKLNFHKLQEVMSSLSTSNKEQAVVSIVKIASSNPLLVAPE